MDNALKPFLEETDYCNFNNPKIIGALSSIKKPQQSEKELAVALFYFVRDKTMYRVGHWSNKASETLESGEGTCTNNANLLVALLRAAGIPAGYGVMDVRGRDYFGPVVPNKLTKNISKSSKHIYTCIYLKGKWLKCDPSDDEPLALSTAHVNPQSAIVDWDGESDSVLELDKKHVLKDESPIPSIDYLMNKKMRKSLYIPVKFANLFIQFLREKGLEIQKPEDSVLMFDTWLHDNHRFQYIFYKWFYWWRHFGSLLNVK